MLAKVTVILSLRFSFTYYTHIFFIKVERFVWLRILIRSNGLCLFCSTEKVPSIQIEVENENADKVENTETLL